MKIEISFLNVIKLLAILFISVFFFNCTGKIENNIYQDAKELVANKKYSEALKKFEKVIRISGPSEISLKAAKEASKISILSGRGYVNLEFFLNHILINSPDFHERLKAQKDLAEIYFEKTQQFPQAIEAYNRLLSLSHSKKDAFTYRVRLARSYFHMGDLYQSQIELNEAYKLSTSTNQKFLVDFQRSEIYMAKKDMNSAIEHLKKMIKNYEDHKRISDVKKNLVVCYEETKKFQPAIDLLNELKKVEKDTQFFDLKIDRIKKRMAQLPGAKGLKK